MWMGQPTPDDMCDMYDDMFEQEKQMIEEVMQHKYMTKYSTCLSVCLCLLPTGSGSAKIDCHLGMMLGLLPD